MLPFKRLQRPSLLTQSISQQTNSTRAKTLEVHIAQRVAAELEKIQKHESNALEALRKKIASGEESKQSNTTSSKTSRIPNLLELGSISPSDLISSSESTEEKARKAQTSQKVQEEIEKLKQTLGQRKVLKDLPPELEKAREGVISCLRVNDRRPLDCYKEVEAFKREVRKLEDSFIGTVL